MFWAYICGVASNSSNMHAVECGQQMTSEKKDKSKKNGLSSEMIFGGFILAKLLHLQGAQKSVN